MTLTKYQRGDQAEGWNDMPALMVSPNNASSIAPRARRKVTRVAHDLNSYISPSLSVDLKTDSSTYSLPPPGKSQVLGPPRMLSSAPNSHTASPTLAPLRANMSVPTEVASKTSPEELRIQARELLLQLEVSRSSLTLNDFTSCVEKVSGSIGSFTESHAIFCCEILEQALNTVGSGTSQMRTQVVNYMMQNENVSSWCIPLRRLVESIR